jgi:hypothetical protein
MTYTIPVSFLRLCAVANILAGILMITGFLLHPTGEDATYGTDPMWIPAHGLLWLADLIALLGWTGLFILQADKGKKFGVVAFIVVLLGTSLSSWIFSSDVTFVPVIAAESPELFKKIFDNEHLILGISSVLIWVLGNILFGISIIKAKVFPNTTGILMIVGIITVPVTYLLGLPIKITAIGAAIVAIAQIWLGSASLRILKSS